MDEALFREGEKAYDAGDYRAAAKAYLASAGRKAEGSGVAYHKAGNALMKLRREHDAVTVYGHALKDMAYEKRGAVWANLAAAHVATASYHDAIEAYKCALEEPGYATAYKALQGMAGALWEMGRFEDAAKSYRRAALEGENPDPGKALNNLGLCFMKMGRPADAVEAYKTAIGLEEYSGKGRAASNLGMAYAALGRHEDACKSFERAVHLHGHTLPADASAAFEECRQALMDSSPGRETVEGWSTGDIPAVPAGAETAAEPAAEPGAESAETAPGVTDGGIPEDPDTDFFTLSEQEMKERDREARRVEKAHRRGQRSPLVTVGVVGGVVLLVAAVLAALYFFGIGWPTQAQAVRGMMEAYSSGKGVEGSWVAVPQADIDKEMQKITPNFEQYSIDGIERTPMTSKVDLTVTPKKGAPMHYKVTLSREGVGWKITGIENDWRSTGGP